MYVNYYEYREFSYIEVEPLEIEKYENDEKGESRYKVTFSKDEIAKLNKKVFEEAFMAGHIGFDFNFSGTYFSTFNRYSCTSVFQANELVDNFSDLFA